MKSEDRGKERVEPHVHAALKCIAENSAGGEGKRLGPSGLPDLRWAVDDVIRRVMDTPWRLNYGPTWAHDVAAQVPEDRVSAEIEHAANVFGINDPDLRAELGELIRRSRSTSADGTVAAAPIRQAARSATVSTTPRRERPASDPPQPADGAGPATAESIIKASPRSMLIESKVHALPGRSWRAVLVQMVEYAIVLGKFSEVPPKWVKDEKKDNRVSSLSNGKFLDTNLDKIDALKRTKRLASILGVPVRIDAEQQDGTVENYPVN